MARRKIIRTTTKRACIECFCCLDKCCRGLMIVLVRAYQLVLSPLKYYLFGSFCGCRFRVTCSAYAIQMYRSHNCLTATYLTLRRILSCNPFNKMKNE